jgi:hypothetical protein
MFFTKKSAVQSIIIENPCSVRWEEMRGDEAVRFCDRCKLNVHNLTGMSQKEAEQLITSQPKRPCVYFYRRDDGVIVTDNCPKMLRPVRNRISAYAAGALLAFSWCLASSVSAQGLVGAPVDPRYGQSSQCGQFSDLGYDAARDIARLVTAVTFLIVFFIPLDERKKDKVAVLVTELVGLAAIPLLVHLAGTFIINNFGGLGGGM